MKSRKFYWFALASVLLGLLALFFAVEFAGRASYARRLRGVDEPPMSVTEQATAKGFTTTAGVAIYTSVMCMLAGAVCLFFSYRFDEPASRSLVVVLIGVYLLIIIFGAV